jgi:hypothetical protein
MPIATLTYVTSTRVCRDLIVERLEEHRDDLGLGYIGRDNERRLPQYPAVVVSAGGKAKEFHGTHTFNIRLECTVWAFHARIDESHAARSEADIELTEAIEAYLEEDLTWGERFISSYVDSIEPGMFQPRGEKSDLVVGTRLSWVALSQQRFR